MGTKAKKCVIIGAAPLRDTAAFLKRIGPDDFLICADGGLDFALENGLCPQLIIGDFDSVQAPVKQETETIVLPCRKDDTDLQFAACEALKRGYQIFLLAGVTGGGRPDHTVAAYCTMAYLLQNKAAVVATDGYSDYYIINHKLILQNKMNYYLSVFPFGGAATGVSIQGASYPLDHAKLIPEYPLGVSNEIITSSCKISVEQGRLLVILTPKEVDNF